MRPHEIIKGPLRLAPLIACAVASAALSFFGLGAAVWANVFGTGTSFLLEGDAFRGVRIAASRRAASRERPTTE